MKKKLTLFMILAVSMLLLTGCGPNKREQFKSSSCGHVNHYGCLEDWARQHCASHDSLFYPNAEYVVEYLYCDSEGKPKIMCTSKDGNHGSETYGFSEMELKDCDV